MTYEDWLADVPETITNDALWSVEVYRLALFLGDLAWYDTCKLAKDRRTLSLSDQLYDAVGGISATISEGFSRASRKDQGRFYEYLLGFALESRDRYYKGRFVLSEVVSTHRMQLLVHVIRLLLKMVPVQRESRVREDTIGYEADPLQSLLQNVPMPEET